MDFILSYNNNEVVLTFPVVPNEAIQLTRGQGNETFDGVNGEIQALGPLQLATFELEGFFPRKDYPFMRPGSSADGWYYVRAINMGRARRIPFRAIHLDNEGRELFNLPVSVESFTYALDQAGDIAYKLSFRQYRFARLQESASLPAQTPPMGSIPTEAPAPETQVVTDSQAAAQEGTSPEGPYTKLYTDKDVLDLAYTMFNEARGIKSKTEIACVGWTVCNRADDHVMGSSFQECLHKKAQFADTPRRSTTSDYGYDLKALAEDVLDRWSREHAGQTDVGRVLPKGYYYYYGKNGHNWFYQKFTRGINTATAWNYRLPSPY